MGLDAFAVALALAFAAGVLAGAAAEHRLNHWHGHGD
jgi:hypothetical protein